MAAELDVLVRSPDDEALLRKLGTACGIEGEPSLGQRQKLLEALILVGAMNTYREGPGDGPEPTWKDVVRWYHKLCTGPV